MNADKIAKRLAKSPSVTECNELICACEPARAEIRIRLGQIQDAAPGYPKPESRLKAIRKGPAAVEELDSEEKKLRAEYDYLNALEAEAGEELQRATIRQVAAAIPEARRRLPSAISAVRDALERLERSIAELGPVVSALGQFELAKACFPLNDSELAELLQLREDVWTTRHVAVLRPPVSGDTVLDEKLGRGFERSSQLFFEHRENGVYFDREPPKRIRITDYTSH